MHQALSILAATTTTVAGSKKSSGSSAFLLFIIIAFAAVYLLFIRPRQQRLRQQQAAARQLEVGDEVVSAGGIHGRVVSLHDDLADVEVAPGVVMTFLKRAVSARPGAPRPAGSGDTGMATSPDAGGTSTAGAIPAATSDSETGTTADGHQDGETTEAGEEDHPSGAGDAAS
jgi:preprotein translocase subunit YajC